MWYLKINMIFCSKCGKMMSEDINYCSTCGTAVGTVEETLARALEPQNSIFA